GRDERWREAHGTVHDGGTAGVPAGTDVVRIVSCGHPPVLLLRDFVACELAAEPGPPLGLGLMDPAPTGSRRYRCCRATG
ncbi:hypothetical protein ACFSNO_28540, partial [Streptomyces cirratus]